MITIEQIVAEYKQYCEGVILELKAENDVPLFSNEEDWQQSVHEHFHGLANAEFEVEFQRLLNHFINKAAIDYPELQRELTTAKSYYEGILMARYPVLSLHGHQM